MSEDPKSSTRPLVSILMAVYHPNDEWLARQLASLNRQTYDNLELIVCDDGPDRPAGQDVIHRYISRFAVSYVVNTRNMGSNWTFERLTAMAAGTYVAYCDQDDIWEEDKIDRLVRRLEETGANLCFSDLSDYR